MAHKPGLIFPAYGSVQAVEEDDEDLVTITDGSTVDIDIIEEEEVQIVTEDSVYFDNDYNDLKNKPYLQWGDDESTKTEVKDVVDLKQIVKSTGGLQMVECDSAATEANKTATCEDFTLEPNTWFQVKMANINTSISELTLSINDEEPKEIWINGVKSSSSNYFIGKGVNSVFYDGVHYNFSEAAAPAVAHRVAHSLIFHTTPEVGEPIKYDGSEQVDIGAYIGHYD